MKNIDFLSKINALVYKESSGNYYVKIPFVKKYNVNESYLSNYNKSLYIKLTNDFLNGEDLEHFIFSKDDTYEFLESGDFENKESFDYNYFTLINNIIGIEFGEEDVLQAYKTFAAILQDYAYVTDVSLLTQIYKKIIKYFANGKYDSTITDMKLLLESTTYNYTSKTNYTNCGCNSRNSQSNLSTELNTENISCTDAYLNAILLYVKQMFGDLNFYYNFFFIETGDPNEDMINALILLLEKVLELLKNNYNLLPNKSNKHCLCAELEDSSTISIQNIILNYIKVLNWVKNCEIEENSNKIKIYGEAFGEIFPNLYFG